MFIVEEGASDSEWFTNPSIGVATVVNFSFFIQGYRDRLEAEKVLI